MAGKGNEGVQGRLMAAYTIINNAIRLQFLLNLVFYLVFFFLSKLIRTGTRRPPGLGTFARLESFPSMFSFICLFFLCVCGFCKSAHLSLFFRPLRWCTQGGRREGIEG